MKYVTIVLSLYILYMVSLPCVDEIASVHNSLLEQTTPHGDPCANHDIDGCSPFCVCSCCGTIVTQLFDTQIIQPIYTLEEEFLSLYKDISSSYFNTFWQPPKIA